MRRGSGWRGRGHFIRVVAVDAEPGYPSPLERNDLELAARKTHTVADLREAPEPPKRHVEVYARDGRTSPILVP